MRKRSDRVRGKTDGHSQTGATPVPPASPDEDPWTLLERALVRQAELERQCHWLEDVCRRQERKLDRYLDLWDQAPVGYLDLDRDGAVMGLNRTSASMLGVPRLALAGRRLADMVDGFSLSGMDGFLAQVFGGWQAAVCEFVVRTRGGDRRVLRLKGSVGADERACRCVLMDVTTLRRTEVHFNQLAAHIDQVYWVADRAIESFVYLSPHCRELMGVDCREFSRNPVMRQVLVHPDDLARQEAALQSARAGEAAQAEFRLEHPDKGLRWLRIRTFPFDENGQPMNAGLVEDITAQKEAEQGRLDQVLRLRDALTREVHHRIKNNLQTVVGLLRREAGYHPQVRELIEAAISQVQSVAVVHGLNASDGGRDVSLCELLPALVGAVSRLHGVHVERIDNRAACGQMRIKESESVAVALILNEIVTNAIKHASGGKAAPQAPLLTMSRKAGCGRIRITNRGRLPDDFDFDTGQGLGTGLGLVKALMPSPGMEIRIARIGDTVVVDLRIEPPVLSLGGVSGYKCEGQKYEERAVGR